MRANAPSSHPILATFAAVARLLASVAEVRQRRAVVNSLASLDDHMLRDIGLNRCDVDSALEQSRLVDATVVLAERAMATRRHGRAMALEAQAWASMVDGRKADAKLVA